jgi:hypothetical protein
VLGGDVEGVGRLDVTVGARLADRDDRAGGESSTGRSSSVTIAMPSTMAGRQAMRQAS